MGYHDVQQVCLNGHQTTENYNSSPQFRKDFCSLCGEETIHKCPECAHPIRGHYHRDGVVGVTAYLASSSGVFGAGQKWNATEINFQRIPATLDES